jgi:hypothetical protein
LRVREFPLQRVVGTLRGTSEGACNEKPAATSSFPSIVLVSGFRKKRL